MKTETKQDWLTDAVLAAENAEDFKVVAATFQQIAKLELQAEIKGLESDLIRKKSTEDQATAIYAKSSFLANADNDVAKYIKVRDRAFEQAEAAKRQTDLIKATIERRTAQLKDLD